MLGAHDVCSTNLVGVLLEVVYFHAVYGVRLAWGSVYSQYVNRECLHIWFCKRVGCAEYRCVAYDVAHGNKRQQQSTKFLVFPLHFSNAVPPARDEEQVASLKKRQAAHILFTNLRASRRNALGGAMAAWRSAAARRWQYGKRLQSIAQRTTERQRLFLLGKAWSALVSAGGERKAARVRKVRAAARQPGIAGSGLARAIARANRSL